MPNYIKSHSNFVLKSRHQDVKDGTVFERDITTIGGVNQFSRGQTPIYRSNNFIITVRNDGRPSNEYNTTKWKENEEGEVWTLQTISGMVSDYEDDNDTKIVLKQDYYDFRDFAYYGSLTELFRASVTDIMKRFPGELFVTDTNAYYTVRENQDFNKVEENEILGGKDYFLVSNPFGINLHAMNKPSNADDLKYFADGGYENYQVKLGGKGKWEDIDGWEVKYSDPCDYSCTCEKIKAKLYTLISSQDGDSVKIGTYDQDTCVVDISASTSEEWIRNIRFMPNGDILATVDENTSTADSRTATITINGTAVDDDDPSCSIEAVITQSRFVPDCKCDEALQVSGDKVISYKRSETPLQIGSYTADTSVCMPQVSVTVNADWLTITSQDNTPILATVDENTSTADSRTATITVSGITTDGKICSRIFNLIQNKKACSCDDATLKVNGETTPFDATGETNVQIGSYTFDSDCISITSVTCVSNWVHILSDTATTIMAKIDKNSSSERQATVSVEGTLSNGTPCSKTFEITQEQAICDCDTLHIGEYNGTNSLLGNTRNSIRQNPKNVTRGSEDENVEPEDRKKELRRRAAKITITTNSGSSYDIYAYLGDDGMIIYLSKDSGLHIRPHSSFLNTFYNDCNTFERLLVNEDSGYKATFSVIRENEDGYYREFVPFQFPIGAGGYNLDVESYGFDAYTKKMVEIGEYYDENFSDNLWRSMTHEAIKNFDWTYTREYVEGDAEEYIFGGQRIQKALRIFAREFDEILSYINNIRNINRVTYDERGNIPDYFLTDVLENEGWDVKLVYPYELTEYYYDENGEKQKAPDDEWSEGDTKNCNGQLNNAVVISGETVHITRDFSQNSNNKTIPYTNMMVGDGTETGYFVICGNDTGATKIDTPCCYLNENKKAHYTFIKAGDETTYYDANAFSGKGAIKNRIKSYLNEKEWTYQEVNNEFLRRLKLNSRYIWRHKGTIDGLEMILAMFGMKSKRWVEAHQDWVINCKYKDEPTDDGHLMWDFDVKEYTSFATRIEEEWDVMHQDYRINWINSTKTIIYDNRFMSNYNTYGANTHILRYEGIPVAYREAYLCEEEPYMKYGNKYYHDDNNNKIIKRYLYPYFDKNEQLDGNPYYQMNGGWLSKTIEGKNIWNFQFDVNDNIVFNEYVPKGSYEEGIIKDNKPLFKETVRNVRRVDNISKLLTIPTVELYSGIICSVTKIEKESAVIDNVVYPIRKEWNSIGPNSGSVVSYISLVKTNGYIRVGNSKFFDTTITVYDVDGEKRMYQLEEKDDGYEVKAYIIGDGEFICQEDETNNYTISNFMILDDMPSGTNYFILDDINYADVLAQEVEDTASTETHWTSGWRRLSETDSEYLRVNTIANYYKGNNPHNGNMVYDNGHEYFTYFNRIFKYASDNELFDERCYEDYFDSLDNEITYYGFDGLIEKNEQVLQYDTFLVEDTKIHYFGNYKSKKKGESDNDDTTIDKVWIYGDDTWRLNGKTEEQGILGGFDAIYSAESESISAYNLSCSSSECGWIEDKNPYGEWIKKLPEESKKKVDDVTNQIVNNKIFDITFRLHNDWYTKQGQEELKYIDEVVMNYLTQMVPSTAILRVRYTLTDVVPTVVVDGSDEDDNSW